MEKNDKPLPCPFCGKEITITNPNNGPWAGFFRAYHRCTFIGYIEISDWTEKLNFKDWNSRISPESK